MYIGAAEQANEQAIPTSCRQRQKASPSDTGGDYFPDRHANEHDDDEAEEPGCHRCPCHPFQIHISVPRLNSAQGKALGEVVAYKPDDQCAGHDGQDTGRCQQTPVKAGGTDGSGHGGGNGLGCGGGQCACEQ